MLTIMCDVDSTLYDADSLFARVAKEMGIPWIDCYNRWFSAEEIGTTVKELNNMFRRCHSREYVSQNEPYPGAAETLEKLVENYNVEIAYVSDRHPQAQQALINWLEDKGFLHNKRQHVIATSDKREWLREQRPQVVIDDRVRTIIMARFEIGADVVSLQHAHNINLTGEIPGLWMCKNWEEISEILNTEILPKHFKDSEVLV